MLCLIKDCLGTFPTFQGLDYESNTKAKQYKQGPLVIKVQNLPESNFS